MVNKEKDTLKLRKDLIRLDSEGEEELNQSILSECTLLLLN